MDEAGNELAIESQASFVGDVLANSNRRQIALTPEQAEAYFVLKTNAPRPTELAKHVAARSRRFEFVR